MSKPENIYDFINNNNNNNREQKRKPFPHEIKKIDPALNAQLLKDFTGERTGFVQVGPKKYFFPSQYENEAENFYNFEVRPNDVWVVTFPRSGTTWTQEMVWLLANNLDYKTAAEIPLTERFPFLEFNMFVHEKTKAEFLKENSYCVERLEMIDEISKPARIGLEETTERRFIKTHLPLSLLPTNLLDVGCKVIYVARNPKDVAVSFYHLNRLIRTQGYVGDFPKYWDYFERNLQPWTPYWSHIEEGWERRNEKNLLFLFYEEMNRNLQEVIGKVSKFMDFDLSSHQLEELENHLKIENFRNNKSVNYDVLKELGILVKGEEGYVRNGKTRGWRNYFDDDLNKRADLWIQENQKRVGITFPE